jgi:hypothetical protein
MLALAVMFFKVALRVSAFDRISIFLVLLRILALSFERDTDFEISNCGSATQF